MVDWYSGYSSYLRSAIEVGHACFVQGRCSNHVPPPSSIDPSSQSQTLSWGLVFSLSVLSCSWPALIFIMLPAHSIALFGYKDQTTNRFQDINAESNRLQQGKYTWSLDTVEHARRSQVCQEVKRLLKLVSNLQQIHASMRPINQQVLVLKICLPRTNQEKNGRGKICYAVNVTQISPQLQRNLGPTTNAPHICKSNFAFRMAPCHLRGDCELLHRLLNLLWTDQHGCVRHSADQLHRQCSRGGRVLPCERCCSYPIHGVGSRCRRVRDRVRTGAGPWPITCYSRPMHNASARRRWTCN